MSLRNLSTGKNHKKAGAADATLVNGTENIDVIAQTIKLDAPSAEDVAGKFGAIEGTAATEHAPTNDSHEEFIETVEGEHIKVAFEQPAQHVETIGAATVSTETIIEGAVDMSTETIIEGAVDMSTETIIEPQAVVVGAAPAAVPVIQTQLDISKIAPRLYVGSAPTDLANPYAGFTMIVLCAEEYQPELPAFNGRIVRAGFNDTTKPTPHDLETAANASEEVYKELVRGGRVLVTCAAGRNRSCLVAGIVLGRKLPAADVIAMIRAARGEQALSNKTYRDLVALTAVKTVSVQQRSMMGIARPVPAVYAKNLTPSQQPPTKPRGILSMILGTGLHRQRGEGKKVAPPGVGRGYYGKRRARGAR